MAVLLGLALAFFVFGMVVLVYASRSENPFKPTEKVRLGGGVNGNGSGSLANGKSLIRPCWRNVRARQ